MTRPWFETTDYTTLDIKKYQSISERQVLRDVRINDVDAVNHILQRIELIPSEGDMMVSWGPGVESIDLFFHGDNQPTRKVEIYQGRFKTPSTGFNPRNEVESSLYADIDALLFPALTKRVLKIKNLELPFDGFSLTYLGVKHSVPAPVSVSWSADQFLLKDASNTERLIEVTSGQLPPAPYQFDIAGAGFTLLTYQTDTRERLFPTYFQVVGR